MSYNSLYNLIGINAEVNRLQKQVDLGWEKEFRTLRWLGLEDGMRILDVGAGPGIFTERLLENLPNCTVTLLEPEHGFVEIAKESLSKYGNRVEIKEQSIYKNDLENNYFDFVISRFVFQHLDDPVLASKEIYRLLRTGGIVAIIDSDRGMSGVREPDILKNERNILGRIEKKTRWNRELGRRLLRVLKASGFNDLDFEVVAIHSDIVGVSNIVGDFKIGNEDIINIARINPKLGQMLKRSKEMVTSQNTIIIILNLIAKGVK